MADNKMNGINGQNPIRPNVLNQQTETLRTSLKPLIGICATIFIGLLVGWAKGWSSSAQNQYMFTGPANHTNVGFVLDEKQWKQWHWVASVIEIGAIVGSLSVIFIIERFGRKMAMCTASVPAIVGCLFICCSNNVVALIVGRLLLGISIGFVYVVVPVYIWEISVDQTVGMFGIFFYLMCTVGIVFANAFGHHLAYSIMCAFMPIGFVVAILYMPESPTYLVNQGRSNDAMKSFKFFHGNDYECNNVVTELENQRAPVNNRAPIWQRIKQLVASKEFYINSGLMFFQQMSGINAVIFYTEFIINTAHGNINIDAVIISIIHVVVTFAASWIVDKFGHRILLTTSIATMALCELLLCVYFSVYNQNSKHSATDWAWKPLVIFSLYIAAYSLGLGPIPWLIAVESFPANMRVMGVSAAATINSFVSFVVVKMFDPIHIGLSFFIAFIVSVLGFAFVLVMVPEPEPHQEPQQEPVPVVNEKD